MQPCKKKTPFLIHSTHLGLKNKSRLLSKPWPWPQIWNAYTLYTLSSLVFMPMIRDRFYSHGSERFGDLLKTSWNSNPGLWPKVLILTTRLYCLWVALKLQAQINPLKKFCKRINSKKSVIICHGNWTNLAEKWEVKTFISFTQQMWKLRFRR